jgi:hypothetical protein
MFGILYRINSVLVMTQLKESVRQKRLNELDYFLLLRRTWPFSLIDIWDRFFALYGFLSYNKTNGI